MNRHNASFPRSDEISRFHPMRMALAGLAALAVAMGIGRFAFTPVMPMMLRDAGLTLGTASWLASANYAGYLLGALMAIFIRNPPERMIRTGLIAIGIATMAMGLTHFFALWMLLRLAAGIASAWVLVGISAWCLERLAVYQRPFLNSVVFSGVGTGIATAGLICIGLAQGHAGSATTWIGLGIVSIGVTGLVWKVFPVSLPATENIPQTGKGTFSWNADAIRLVCCYGIFGFGYILPATFLPVMARNALHGSGLFVWSWPVFGLAATIATLSVSSLRQRIGNRRLWAASHWIMATGIVLPVFWPNMLTIFAAALCVGGTFMVITLVALLEAKPVAGNHAPVLIAAMTSAFAAGQIIGPLTVRASNGNQDGFSTGLTVAAALLAGSTLLLKRSSGASSSH